MFILYICCYYNTITIMSSTKPPIKSMTLREHKMKVIDIIIDMYPELKKSKDEIVAHVFDKNNYINKYIFTKYVHNSKDLYVDPYGLILDKYLVFNGFFVDGKYYILDDDFDNINIQELDKLMKK